MLNPDVLRCPCIDKMPLQRGDNVYFCTKSDCEHASNGFRVEAGRPILISELRCDTVCETAAIGSFVPRTPPGALASLRDFLVGVSEVTEANCARFVAEVVRSGGDRVLVVGAGDVGSGTKALYGHSDLEITGVDVYLSEGADVVCDGHYLPFAEGAFDGVWIQAVLEHVVDPPLVVSEIHRVLRKDGVIYAEVPFMQQVHEGAYDFTRFTVLGLRYLFRRFELIQVGGNKGANVALAWSIRYFMWALFRSRKLAQVTGVVMTVLLRPFGSLLDRRSLFDSPSGVYFLGRKSEVTIPQKALLPLYGGMMK